MKSTMKSTMKITPSSLLVLALGITYAAVRADAAALDRPGHGVMGAGQPVIHASDRKKPSAHWRILSNGQQVDLSQWKVVVFMQYHCPYCHQFDPLLKRLGERMGFSVFPYTLDGQGDETYPGALPAPADVVKAFFPSPMPIATPTTFLVNVNTLNTWPIMQGASDEYAFLTRLDRVFQEAVTKEAGSE